MAERAAQDIPETDEQPAAEVERLRRRNTNGRILGPSTPTGDAAVRHYFACLMAQYELGKLTTKPTIEQAAYWSSDAPSQDSNWGE